MARYFLTDHLGSTEALADSSGAIVSSTTYDSFGNATSSIATSYQYTGIEYASDTGLYYYRNRWYDPEIGLFISEDPIGFAGGDVNLYGYVGNNPHGYIDPFGFQGWGETIADWLDSGIEKARLGAQGDASSWIRNGLVNTLADLASIAPDTLRFGKGIGCALFNDQASGYDRAWAVANDALRGLTLPGVGIAAKGIGKAVSKARATKSLPTPKVTNPKLKNLVDDLYKGAKGPNTIGTGSTADAVRNELKTGLPTHGRFHSQKAQEYSNALNKWLKKNPNASDYDKMIARSLLNDLQSALGGN